MKFNFDEIVDRSQNYAAKFQEAELHYGTNDVIPLWIADMDFKTAQPIIDALKARAEEGIWGYTARPDSYFDGVSVYDARFMAGRFLAQDSPVEADLVVGVPESGNVAAMGFAAESGIPYGTAFVKNTYVGRTFIKPKQSSRESSVRVKLNVLRSVVAGKRIVMIDDSIVRGTTSDLIVHMLREAGAKEVHVRISAPPFLHPCYFGTDIPSEDQLIAHKRTIEEIRQILGADSLSYLKLERLSQMAEGRPICTACFSGRYPIEPPKEDIRGNFEP